MAKPNLFIVGSMKCGTTILTDFLSAHPEVTVAEGKEVHYFSLYETKGLDWYLEKFDFTRGTKYYVDASPTYFDLAIHQPVAKKLHEFNSDAKIIALIRDPLERALSHFSHLRRVNGIPELQGLTFAEFVSGDWSRAVVMDTARNYHLGNVLGFSAYSRKITLFAGMFGADNVMVINNDDLRRNGPAVMADVLDFLGLAAPDDADYAVQRYLGGTDVARLEPALRRRFYDAFGADYIAACTQQPVRRPQPKSPAERFNVPERASVNGVAVGRDGWLFLAGGTNDPVDLCLDTGGVTSAVLPRWYALLRERVRRLGERGVRYLHAFIPEKLSIYGEHLDWGLSPQSAPGRQFLEHLPPALRPHALNLFSYLHTNRNARPLYFKTDSHWNAFGAYSAYQMMCVTLGVEARKDLLQRTYTSGEALLDLGSKLPTRPRETVRYYAIRQEAEVVEEGELVRFKRREKRENDAGLHVGSLMRYRNATAPSAMKVLLFGDSFSEYRDHLLSAMLAETFAEFTFVWTTSIDYRLVDELAPDTVLTACTERFMTRVPDDTVDMRALASAVVRDHEARLAARDGAATRAPNAGALADAGNTV